MLVGAHDVDSVWVAVDDAEYGNAGSESMDKVQELESGQVCVAFALAVGEDRVSQSEEGWAAMLTVTRMPSPRGQCFQY